MSSVSGKKLLIIAIACGVLAALLGWLYLKAKESQYRSAYQPASQVMVSVIVPKVEIDKSQSLTPENVAVMDVPRDYLPSNAVTADDWPELENRMTVHALQKGRPITWDAVEQDGVSRFSENVELGKRVKTVKISKINSFDGMLRPGDRIDLLGSFAATDIGLQEQTNYSNEVVINVLQDVEVLAAGRQDAKGRKYENHYDRSTPDGFNMNFSTLSLMLTPAQVARVELAEKAGELVAVLRHPKDSSSAELGQVTVSSLLDPPAIAAAPPTIFQPLAAKSNPNLGASGRWFRDDFSCAEKRCFPDGAELLNRHLPPTRNYSLAPSSSVLGWKCVRGQNLRSEPLGSTEIRWLIRS